MGDAEGPLAPHPLVRVASFAHDPQVLLPLLAAKHPLPYDDVPAGDFHLLLDRRDGRLAERPLEPHLAAILLSAAAGGDVPASPERDELAAAGVLVHARDAEAGVREIRSEMLQAVG
jgi:hypothetical protein